MKWLSVFVVILASNSWGMSKPPPEATKGLSYTYTSSPRLYNLETGQELTLYQNASDVARINVNFSESDIERIDTATSPHTVTTIYDCTSSAVICAAQEGRISPNGKLLAYSVSFGDRLYGKGLDIANVLHAEIRIHNLETGEDKPLPNQVPTAINRMPDWINNTTLVYSSDEANMYGYKDQCSMHQGKRADGSSRWCNPPWGYSQVYKQQKSMQIWRSNLDGTDKRNLTPQEAMAIEPLVLKHPHHKGRILYSTLQYGEDKGFGTGTNAFTIQNMWWIASMDQNGANGTVVIGGHKSALIPNSRFLDEAGVEYEGGQQYDRFLALRGVGEDLNGRITVSSYYRANHYGLGNSYSFTILDHSVEGISTSAHDKLNTPYITTRPGSGQFMPYSLKPVTPFAVGQDIPQRFSEGRVMGKTGFPSQLPNGNMQLTRCRGWCFIQPNAEIVAKVYAGGEPLRDEGIYEVVSPDGVVTNPFDEKQLVKIFDDPMKLERDASAIVASKVPPQTPALNPADGCFLQVVNVKKAELSPAKAYTHGVDPERAKGNFRYLGEHTAFQGNSVKSDDPWSDGEHSRFTNKFHEEQTKYFGIHYVDMWDITYPDARFVQSQNYSGIKKTYPPLMAEPQVDGSIKFPVDCGRQFKMSTFDQYGAQVTHDAMIQQLPAGETRTCHGCHDGHSVERWLELGGKPAADLFPATLASSKPPAVPVQEPDVTFQDVLVVIEKAKCGDCHSGPVSGDDFLWDALAADREQLDWSWVRFRNVPNNNRYIIRPCFSPFVCRYANWSLLYWVAMNERTDGYNNETFLDDPYFPEEHPKVMSREDARKIAIWIEMGAQK